MLEKNNITQISTADQQQRKWIYAVLIGVLVGLFLLLVRLLFKESTFRKKGVTQKQSTPPTPPNNTNGYAPAFAQMPVPFGATQAPVKNTALIPTDAGRVAGGSLIYPTATTGVAQPNPAVDVTYPDQLAWQGEAIPQSDVTAEITNWKALGREFVETIVLTLLIFLIMRALIQNYRIEGYSMEPNLHEQQYLIVNKVAYYLGEPKRGDIIVFEYPNGPETDYIKRVIGVPGDTVECRPNQIVVNGQVIEEPYGPNPWNYTCPPLTLADDEYFVLGDNRSQSSDSHKWGPLERKFIIGKAWVSYWPMESWGRVSNYEIDAPEPKTPVAQSQ